MAPNGTSTAPAPAMPAPSPHTIDPSHDPGSNTTLYICAGVGGGVFALVLITLVVLFLKRRRRRYSGSFGYSESARETKTLCFCCWSLGFFPTLLSFRLRLSRSNLQGFSFVV